MSVDADKVRLQQTKMLEWLQQELPLTNMITVFLSEVRDGHDYGVFCALIPSSQVNQVLQCETWDFSEGYGLPGAIVTHEDGIRTVGYFRFGSNDGIEPLVFVRSFHGIFDSYPELLEEFRHFHDLYHDRKSDQYIKLDDAGNRELIAIVESNMVQVRLKELRQFLAVKEMYLSVQFDCREHSAYTLEDLGVVQQDEEYHDDLLVWSRVYGDFGGLGEYQTFSRLMGKRLIAPLPKEKSGIWGFGDEHEKEYLSFVIGVDQHGDGILHTSDPDALANNFGKNPDAPHYLTPVYFQKEVLDKYYHQPSKYSVEDGILRCGYLWTMYIDNHHDDVVVAWLGDLGRNLPYREQYHWRSCNIAPLDNVSDTYIRRQLLAQFADSDRPEHLFFTRYDQLGRGCDRFLGWRILLPLESSDLHFLQNVRVPATDEQRDFDAFILGLAKILIDSLNEHQLTSSGGFDGVRGISALQALLNKKKVEDKGDHIGFLRKIQGLRSSGAAHRKGREYRKNAAAVGVDSRSLRDIAKDFLVKGVSFLEFLIAIVEAGTLKDT